jgi:radical SAM family uncharacterized protein
LQKAALDDILQAVERPARYTGGEWNMAVKRGAALHMALCFPDVYEIGMSHLGSRILYRAVNMREEYFCERVFAPWPDMEAALRENGLPLFSLETKRPLGAFDIIGFSLLYEMCYTNILTMLDLARIPFLAKDREGVAPLIVCGGPSACNPEPLADIMDAVMVGDGEEMLLEVLDTLAACHAAGKQKRDALLALSKIEGVYVPSFYEPQYQEGRFAGLERVEPQAPASINRRVVKDLDAAPYIGKPIVPNLSIVHDRAALELFRGCTRGCRFCQAGFIYRPVRERRLETLLDIANELVECTGYDELSLFSLSSSDYSAIHELVTRILNSMQSRRVSVSLPSLRADKFLKSDLERMQEVRKSGLTFAPEAGTQRLRDVINKGVREEDLLRVAQESFESGWTGIKLYFMIGLPTETDEDIVGIAGLAKKVSRLFYAMPKEKRIKALRLTVSASSFVPKPFTPFQWVGQDTAEELRRKQQLLGGALKGIRGVEFNYHASMVSMLEAVFSRGDRRLAQVLVEAYRRGCRFDSWDEHFRFAGWQAAFDACHLDIAEYAHRERDVKEALPWDHIDILVEKSYLLREYALAQKGVVTRDCRSGCNHCFGEKYADYCQLS